MAKEQEVTILGKKLFIYPEQGLIIGEKIPFKDGPYEPFSSGAHLSIPPITAYTFCLMISDACNLKCDYCFNVEKSGRTMTADDAIKYLEKLFKLFPNGEKYYIDLSGNGEPLLALPTIVKIARYCRKKSDALRCEVLPRFVTNGTLLTPRTVNLLQNNGVLFGVSLDGDAVTHNLHRHDAQGRPTFDIIMGNVTAITHRDYVGCAITITNNVFSLLDTLLELSKTFKTISVRPCRGEFGIIDETLQKWLDEYDRLTLYIASQFKYNDVTLLKCLLNGEDFLGNYICNLLTRNLRLTRCNQTISRFAVNIDGKIQGCAAQDTLTATDLDESLYKLQKENYKLGLKCCEDCGFKLFCGGICPLLNNAQKTIACRYQKHLVLLSAYILDELLHYPHLFDSLRQFAFEKLNRDRIDPNLKAFLSRHSEYTFTEGKRIYDSLSPKY